MLELVHLAAIVVLSSAAPDFCSFPKETGDFCSEPAARMFYYDSRYKVCQPFQYNGCGGNKNRFSSASECKAGCQLSGPVSQTSIGASSAGTGADDADVFVPQGDRHDQWRKADKCGSNYLIPNGKYIRCGSGCPAGHTCTEGVCCPSKDYVCSLRDDNGVFQQGIEDRPRFSWNHNVKSCERFSYYGANGNYNNFPNFYSCMNYCKDSKPQK